MTAADIRELVQELLHAAASHDGTMLAIMAHKGVAASDQFELEARQTTTGSEQIRLTVDGETFNITITKARS